MSEPTKETLARLRELHGKYAARQWATDGVLELLETAFNFLPALLDAVEQRDKMRKLLEELEHDPHGYCVTCNAVYGDGHEPNCEWAEAMK